MSFLRCLWCSCIVVFCGSAVAETIESAQAVIEKQLGEVFANIAIRRISESPIPGVYEVESNIPKLLYVSADGRHFVAGDIYEIDEGRIRNPGQERLEKKRTEALSNLQDKDMVIFRPEKVLATITVFTDVDCGYCRKLHREVKELNDMGVQVNYLAFPREGVGSGTYMKMVSIWCSDDPKAAMTQAKNGIAIPEKTGCDNPVDEEYELGNELGVNGTPAILLSDGKLIPGYVPAQELGKRLGLLGETATTAN
jgi:thiol:disulfide interchange protein DsbC